MSSKQFDRAKMKQLDDFLKLAQMFDEEELKAEFEEDGEFDVEEFLDVLKNEFTSKIRLSTSKESESDEELEHRVIEESFYDEIMKHYNDLVDSIDSREILAELDTMMTRFTELQVALKNKKPLDQTQNKEIIDLILIIQDSVKRIEKLAGKDLIEYRMELERMEGKRFPETTPKPEVRPPAPLKPLSNREEEPKKPTTRPRT